MAAIPEINFTLMPRQTLDNERAVSQALLTALTDIVGCIDDHDFEPLDCDRRGDKFCNCLDKRIAAAKEVIAKAGGRQ